MEYFTNDIMRGLLADSLETATLADGAWKEVGKGPGSRAGEFIEWLTVKGQTQSVINDVERIRSHALVPHNIAIHGYIYDVGTGRLNEVTEATLRGAATTAR